MNTRFDIVAAMDLARGIGKGGQLPWRLPADLKHFKELTSTVYAPGLTNAVIMGRKTWESLPEARRPLPHRINVVLTRDQNYSCPQGVLHASSLDQALAAIEQIPVEQRFVIGGGEVYRAAIDHVLCRFIYLTEVRSLFDCDTFFPAFENNFAVVSTSEALDEAGVEYTFKTYERVSSILNGP